MEEDIDIEEHDVLDDPRIKGIFPDLTCVKIEVHDAEVSDTIAQQMMIYPEVPIKEEQEDFEGTDYTDFDQTLIAQTYDDQELPPEDIYHYKNKIILGSKPCQREHTLNIEQIVEINVHSNNLVEKNYDSDVVVETNQFIDDVIVLDDDIVETSEHSDDIVVTNEHSDDNVVTNEHSDDIDVTNEYYVNLDEVVDAKEHLDAVVVLVDWAQRLEQSRSFCKHCEILFATPNALDAHNMSTHSLLVAVTNNKAVKSTAKSHANVARKSTTSMIKKELPVKREITIKKEFKVKKEITAKNSARKSTSNIDNVLISKYCNHCNQVFSDHRSLITHLYELLPLKQFICNVCNAKFNDQKDLIDHNVVHVKFEKAKIKKEKTEFLDKLVFEDEAKKKVSSPKKEIVLIPKSVLFQCTKCNVHSASIFSGYQHSYSCNPNTWRALEQCKVCKRTFRKTDIILHKKQHELCTKFKVFKTTTNLYERTLCKCPKCALHFSYLSLKTHLNNCGKIASGHCQKCNILLPTDKLIQHLKIHYKLNLKPKDFIVIEHEIQIKGVKRKVPCANTPNKRVKVEFDAKTPKKILPKKNKVEPVKIKTEPGVKIRKKVIVKKNMIAKTKNKLLKKLKFESGSKIRMYFCKRCNSCANNKMRIFHGKKSCKNIKHTFCRYCGLQFTQKTIISHENLHKKRYFTIHDIVFFQMCTQKRGIPKMPVYPKCVNCHIRFFTNKMKHNHICGENYETCNDCNEKFDISVYEIHKEFHKLKIPTARTEAKQDVKIMPELLKNYESLKMMWNILFLCEKCEVVTDLYDKAVEHSQRHLKSKKESRTIKCYICNLKFDETCWAKHSDLHSQMNINKKDFQILRYAPQKLLTDEWFQLFESLPETQVKQIINGSLYGYERAIKMKLIKDGRSEFTLYCCSNCKVCIDTHCISEHLRSKCKKTRYSCEECDLPFDGVESLKYHETVHQNGVNKHEFRVVSFLKSVVEKFKGNVEAPNSIVLYKCKECHACVQNKCNINRHKCSPSGYLFRCPYCDQLMFSSSRAFHTALHAKQPTNCRGNVKILYFNSSNPMSNKQSENGGRRAKNKPDNVNKKKRKTDCDSEYAPKAKKRTTLNSSRKRIDSPKTEIKTAKIFKCNCGLHFTTLASVERHVCGENSEISSENCSKCGLLFPTDVLVSHLCKHHSINTKIVVEIYIKPENGNRETKSNSAESTLELTESTQRVSISPSKKYKFKLYKCHECNVHFLSQSTCYRHVYKNHAPLDPKNYIECKICGLQFSIKTLLIHMKKHHKDQFNLDDVLIEDYRPPNGKDALKIDLYYASDKVQSLQVSSSIEGS